MNSSFDKLTGDFDRLSKEDLAILAHLHTLHSQKGLAHWQEIAVIPAMVMGLMLTAILMLSAYVIWGWTAGIAVAGAGIIFTIVFCCAFKYLTLDRGRSRPNKLLVAILQAEDEGHALTNLKGEILFANSAYRRIFRGDSPSPLEWQVKSDDGVSVAEMMNQAGTTQTIENSVIIEENGQDVVLGVKMRKVEGCVLWRIRLLNPEALFLQSSNWLKSGLEPALSERDMGLILVDHEGAIHYASPEAHNLLDLSSSQSIPDALSDILDPGGLLDQRNNRAEDIVLAVEMPMPSQLGDEAPGHIVILRASAEPGEDAPDVLDRAFEDILSDAPISTVAVDGDGNILMQNPAFLELNSELFGKPAKVGQNIAELFDVEQKSDFEAKLAATIAGVPPSHAVEVFPDEDRNQVLRLYFARGLPGASPHALLYFIDDSEQRRLETQFVQAQKMQAVGQLAGGVAHDFNNLLTAIIGFCDLLLVRPGPGDPSFGDLMQIKQNSNRAANLVRQLLAFSRRQTLRPRILNVTDTLQELSNLIRRLIGERIELKMIHGRDVGDIKADLGQLEQVIINLAVNARDAMDGAGKLTIQSRSIAPEDVESLGKAVVPPGHYVQITVSDTGMGIPLAYLDKIFEPFFTTKEVGKGTGLGLSTVYGIVKQTGGFIFVESAPGVGASFDIFLPRYQRDEVTVAKTRITEQPAADRDLTGMGTILVVEDEDPVRAFATRALQNKGYNVLEAANGEEALEILRGNDGPIDLLISDVVMPSIDGPTLARMAREYFPKLKIVMISGYAEDAFRQEFDASDMSFLPKPFSLTQLAEEVKRAMSE